MVIHLVDIYKLSLNLNLSGGNLDNMNTVGINLTESSPYQCAEAIFYDRILTAEECRKVEKYLIAKYCIM